VHVPGDEVEAAIEPCFHDHLIDHRVKISTARPARHL
jgi:hypothetical protein